MGLTILDLGKDLFPRVSSCLLVTLNFPIILQILVGFNENFNVQELSHPPDIKWMKPYEKHKPIRLNLHGIGKPTGIMIIHRLLNWFSLFERFGMFQWQQHVIRLGIKMGS